jgi:hypothetical protein
MFSSIWRKLYIISIEKDHYRKSSTDEFSIMELKSKPVIQFYLFAYGLALIICGINVMVSRERSRINKM